ncbi:hypothetical protein [Blastococcus sp. Marseille-P5729]|uniref:hypothetical protein n=1 Tax=Blastococcus sp. Marseille-P5729 TaxID=2086582 RepID=UPI000D0E3739|nr:hypothetical protein [Blastococcus sp. Marseille-P5729]
MSLTAAPRRSARRSRLAAAAIALPMAVGLALTGCSAGQHAQTTEKRPAVEGSTAETGDLRILNAHFVSPGEDGKYEAGAEVEMEMVVTSTGAADEITSITVDGAEATISGGGGSAGQSGAPEGDADTNSEAPSAEGALTVPADGMLVIGGDQGEATVTATLADEAYPTTLIPVTISFREAGDVEIEVPIAVEWEDVPRDPEQQYHPKEGEGGGH